MYNIIASNLSGREIRSQLFSSPHERNSREAFLLKNSNLDLSTFCNDLQKRYKNYSQFRRFVKSISRLNYLQYINFNFGRCTAITFTISNEYIKDKKAVRFAIIRIENYFRRLGIKFYVVAKELGEEHNRLHYHFILLNAPFLSLKKLDKIWRIGKDIKVKEVKNYGSGVAGGVAYISYYIKKGLNLQWSRGFFKEKILSNDVYYLVKYDKKNKKVYIDNIFNVPFISKNDYAIHKGHIPAPILALLSLKMQGKYLKKENLNEKK